MKDLLAKMTNKIPRGKKYKVHDESSMDKIGLKHLHRFSQKEIDYKLENYFKFLVVRHPFDRILSAFRNKFEIRSKLTVRYFHHRYGKGIIRRFRPNASQESLKEAHDVTFPEFVKFVIFQDELNKELNDHWRPIYDECYPQHIKYDYIAKMDTLEMDTRYLLTKFGQDGCFDTIPHYLQSNTSSRLQNEYYNKISKSERQKLYKIYKNDFLLFNYTNELS